MIKIPVILLQLCLISIILLTKIPKFLIKSNIKLFNRFLNLISEVFNMLRNWTSHNDYQKRLIADLSLLILADRERVFKHEANILKLYLLDLDKAFPIINKLYPENTGRPAKNQVEILRSLILMTDLKIFSITHWAKLIACDKFICTLCGFNFHDVPKLASFYDFIDRLWQQLPSIHSSRVKALRPFKSKPRKKLKSGQKLPPKHSGVVKKLVSLAKNNTLREQRYESVFQNILAKVVVETSSSMGLLGDPDKLSIAGDGTPFYSGSSHFGTKVCNCFKKGFFKCKCLRKYSDPDATWGWDSYRERYFFGSTFYCITASDSPHDLPIYLRNSQAKRHDSIITIFALNEVRKIYPAFTFDSFIADGAMDNYPTYELCNHWNIKPFIPLNSRTSYNFNNLPPGVFAFDDAKNPICEGGIPYVNWGWCPQKNSIKYRCYFDAFNLDKPCKCSNSSYGRTVYIKSDFDPRLFPPVPRSSKSFKIKFKRRTSVERTHKRIFEDYSIESGKMRSNKQRFSRATFAAINIHLDAWLKYTELYLEQLLA